MRRAALLAAAAAACACLLCGCSLLIPTIGMKTDDARVTQNVWWRDRTYRRGEELVVRRTDGSWLEERFVRIELAPDSTMVLAQPWGGWSHPGVAKDTSRVPFSEIVSIGVRRHTYQTAGFVLGAAVDAAIVIELIRGLSGWSLD